jgi:hypothetical protein
MTSTLHDFHELKHQKKNILYTLLPRNLFPSDQYHSHFLEILHCSEAPQKFMNKKLHGYIHDTSVIKRYGMRKAENIYKVR